MDIIDYLKKYGNSSFDELEFNEVDSVILCQLAYFDYSNTPICNKNLNYTLKEFLNIDYTKQRVRGIWDPKRNDVFARTLKSAKRFYTMKLGFHTSEISKEAQKQFSAVIFHIKDDIYYISYRGTDSHIVGWKEDFNLGYLENIPSQLASVEFFENFAKGNPGTYYIGGHSKGGNLAIYASVMAKNEYKQNIIKVYNHDGPGFLPTFYQKEEYISIKDKINKSIPKSAIVGLLLEQNDDYQVVDCKSILLLQHDLFKWMVDENHLKYVSETTKFSRHTRKSVSNWIYEMDLETRETVINAIYSLIAESNDERISQFLKHGFKNIFIMRKKLNGFDPKVKKVIKKVFYEFCKNYVGLTNNKEEK